ncbi:MAG TPA: hypothetical protein VNO31_39700 [Umezawaea sp.]|nr:hypothetical protein [Umezawaea sp.]
MTTTIRYGTRTWLKTTPESMTACPAIRIPSARDAVAESAHEPEWPQRGWRSIPRGGRRPGRPGGRQRRWPRPDGRADAGHTVEVPQPRGDARARRRGVVSVDQDQDQDQDQDRTVGAGAEFAVDEAARFELGGVGATIELSGKFSRIWKAGVASTPRTASDATTVSVGTFVTRPIHFCATWNRFGDGDSRSSGVGMTAFGFTRRPTADSSAGVNVTAIRIDTTTVAAAIPILSM